MDGGISQDLHFVGPKKYIWWLRKPIYDTYLSTIVLQHNLYPKHDKNKTRTENFVSQGAHGMVLSLSKVFYAS